MLRVNPDWTTRKVGLSHRGLTYEVHAATAHSDVINGIREFGSSLRELYCTDVGLLIAFMRVVLDPMR